MHGEKSSYLYPNDFSEELIDHINISIHSISMIGQLLSPEFIRDVFYPRLGRFSSVYSLWAWLREKDHPDILRGLKPDKIKRYFQVSEEHKTIYVKNFKAIIATATWMKFKNQIKVIEQVKKLPSDIHFLFYAYVGKSNIRITSSLPSWTIDIAEEIIKAIKEDREPDFLFLASHKDEIGSSYAEGVLKEICPKEEE